MKEYAANIIASNIYEEGDADAFLSSLLHQIVDHKSLGEKIKLEDKYITTRTGMDGWDELQLAGRSSFNGEIDFGSGLILR